jgi:invasion protein IalB
MLICAHPEVRMKGKKESFVCKDQQRQPRSSFSQVYTKGAGNRENDVLSRLPRPGGLQVPCGCKVTLDKKKMKNKDYENSKKEKKGFRWPRATGGLSHTHKHT